MNSTPPHGPTAPSGPWHPHYRGFRITLRHTTQGRTPLDEWSARRRDLYLITHNTIEKLPCRQRDANPQSQQASCRRPQTARPAGSAVTCIALLLCISKLQDECWFVSPCLFAYSVFGATERTSVTNCIPLVCSTYLLLYQIWGFPMRRLWRFHCYTDVDCNVSPLKTHWWYTIIQGYSKLLSVF